MKLGWLEQVRDILAQQTGGNYLTMRSKYPRPYIIPGAFFCLTKACAAEN